MVKTIIIFVLVFIPALKIAFGHYRHAEVNGKLVKAWHITLPGYDSTFYPEQTVQLKDWVGTRLESLTAADIESGKENPEVTAGIALKALGVYPDYTLEQGKDGHWVLHRPGRITRRFTLGAYRRVGPWKDADRAR